MESGVGIGGIFGWSGYHNYMRQITNCENRGTIDGTYCIGGIAGFAYLVNLTDVSNYGIIKASGDYIGGVVGALGGGKATRAKNYERSNRR